MLKHFYSSLKNSLLHPTRSASPHFTVVFITTTYPCHVRILRHPNSNRIDLEAEEETKRLRSIPGRAIEKAVSYHEAGASPLCDEACEKKKNKNLKSSIVWRHFGKDSPREFNYAQMFHQKVP